MTRTRFLVVLFFSVYLLVNSDDSELGSERNKTGTPTTTTKSSENPVGPPSLSEGNNAKDDSRTKESGANTSEKGKEDENSQVKETKSSSGTSLMTRLKSSEEDSTPDPFSTPLSTTISASLEKEIKKINDIIQYIPPRDQIKAVVKMLANEKVDQKKANEDIGALKILTETGKKANDEIGTLKEEIGALKIEKVNMLKENDKEHKLRLVFQSYIDIRPAAERLFIKCWPRWVGERKENTEHNEKNWKILLMNIENPIIYELRKQLDAAKISMETFIEKMIFLERTRHANAHEEMKEEEKGEGYSLLAEREGGKTKDVLAVFTGSVNDLDQFFETKPDTSQQLNSGNSIYQATSEERKYFKVLYLPNFPVAMYEFTETTAKEMFERYSKTHPDKNISIPSVVVLSPNLGAYFLFDSFDSAFKAWSEEEIFDSFRLDRVSSKTILDTRNRISWDSFSVKINMETIIFDDLKNKVGWGGAISLKRLENKNENIMHVIFDRIDLALTYYQNCKEAFKPELFQLVTNPPSLKGIKTLPLN